MKKVLMIFMLLLTVGMLSFTGCNLTSKDSGSKYEKDEDEVDEDEVDEDEVDENEVKEDEVDEDNENSADENLENELEDSGVASEVTVEPYGFTAYFDPQKEPEGVVDSYSPTDTMYYVVIGGGFPAGSSIHQVWEYLEDGSTIEGDLNIPVDVEYNYLGFNLTPDGQLPVGRYQVTLTWNVNGVDGELVSDIIEVR